MALLEEFEARGNWFFRHRSYLPVVMYVLASLVIWLQPQDEIMDFDNFNWGIICFGVSFLGIIVRALVIGFVPKATSGRNTKEGQVADTLNTKGIYSTVRHPLYLGNYFMWLGIILYVGNIWFTIVCSLLYWLYYERIMFAEEQFLRGKFGSTYTDWAKNVPPFWPKWSQWSTPGLEFSLRNVLKREYSGLLAMVISFPFLNAMKHWFLYNELTVDQEWIYVLVFGVIITLTLRTLKKTTKVLEVKGR